MTVINWFREVNMEGCFARFQILCQTRSRRLISVIVLMVGVMLIFQNFSLPSLTVFSTLISTDSPATNEGSSLNKDSSSLSQRRPKPPFLSDPHELINSLNISKRPNGDFSKANGELQKDEEYESDDDKDLDGDENPNTEFSINFSSSTNLKKVRDSKNPSNSGKTDNGKEDLPSIGEQTGSLDDGMEKRQEASSVMSIDNVTFSGSFLNTSASNATILVNESSMEHKLSMSEINNILLKIRALSSSKRPRWPSARDKELMYAREKIENAPIVESDKKFHAPMYQNFSKFKRSYELMEKTLKIYIYQEGEKPIFHQPVLSGIYASEGWFMKLLESNKHYLVRDPSQAHLFYIPFSSKLLQIALYVPDSHNRTKLRQHIKNYVDMIMAKYPFWNRTGSGFDHFVVACHDWALDITNNSMGGIIRSVCVSDLHMGFQLGKDVSLPETNVRSPKNPLKNLGGRPWNQRPIFVFFAGSLHGNLRSIILNHWESKDPDMKIFGPTFVRSKMDYTQHMKNSKFCLCPRGYEANSPRIVESIFFECVPVIIADDYVPPFFETLNWEKFSVFVLEKDVPRLKEILVSIAESEYRELHMGVKRVQRHFLWHTKPVKYDLFHMILHSIWLSRVYN